MFNNVKNKGNREAWEKKKKERRGKQEVYLKKLRPSFIMLMEVLRAQTCMRC